jgi:hypothetical protein
MKAFDDEFGSDYRFDQSPSPRDATNVAAIKTAHATADRQNLDPVHF